MSIRRRRKTGKGAKAAGAKSAEGKPDRAQ